MKKVGIILIAMQGILLILLAVFKLNDAYLEAWSQYGKTQDTLSIYLENISEENEDELEQYLYTEADSNKLYIIRRESILAKDGDNGTGNSKKARIHATAANAAVIVSIRT